MKRTSTKTRTIAAVGAGLFLTVGLAACSSDSDSSAATTPAPATSAPMDSPSMESPTMMDPASQVFGSGCAAVPADGDGSFVGMATEPVATAASANPLLSTLVTAVTEANLGDTLNSAKDITVFAPSNDAFAALPKKTLDAALADPTGLLTTVLTYHVVPGKLTPEDLAGTHKTLEGDTIKIAGSGEDFTVNGNAKVVCGNVPTANATVYIIDNVLLPPM